MKYVFVPFSISKFLFAKFFLLIFSKAFPHTNFCLQTFANENTKERKKRQNAELERLSSLSRRESI